MYAPQFTTLRWEVCAHNQQFTVANATLASESPAFKLRFSNSDSKPSQASNNKGQCLYTQQLSKVPAKAASRSPATADTNILTISQFYRLRTLGSSATRAFRHQGVPAITVDSCSRHLVARTYGSVDGGLAHTTSRSRTIFGITGGVWSVLN